MHLAILAMSLLFCVNGIANQKIIYESVTKGESIQAFWSIEKKENKSEMDCVKKDKKIHVEYLLDNSLSNYTEGTSEKNFCIEKTGPCLIVKNSEKGREKVLSHRIGNKLWIQEFNFGFQNFIRSEKKSCDFCIVYPKDLALHEMVATKEGEEEIQIAGKKYKTQKVKITLDGFKKQFWKAYAWFDKETALLVRYKANEGPRTPYTETSLITPP